MKVLHWNRDFFPKSGGGPTHVAGLISSMRHINHVVITDDLTGLDRKENYQSNSKIIRFPSKPCKKVNVNNRILRYLNNLCCEIGCINEKIHYATNNQYEILHVHGLGLYSFLATLNKYLYVDLYNHMLNFSNIRKPKVLTLHNLMISNEMVNKIYDNFIKQFDFIICVDENIYKYASTRFSSTHCKTNFFYIPNGIDIEKFKAYDAPIERSFAIGFVGRIASTVDVEMIILLAQSLPSDIEFKLAISGDTSRMLEYNFPSNVSVDAYIENNNMPEFYNRIDILFNPILHGAISRVTLESMSCGIPVMMYEASNRSILFSDDNIITVSRSAREVIRKIKFLQRNSKVRNHIGDSAANLIKVHFSNQVQSKKTQDVYDKALIGV
jgi:glycosyltransferase involved in cell wall biosynthesis